MAASSYFTSQKHNYSQGTNWSATRVLMGDGTWVDKANPIYVANTVFVSKLGDDATGAVQRFDLPFLTIAAARTATLAYWTGGTAPSATNRIRIVVQSGRYLEKIVLANFVDWDLTNSIIDLQAGDLFTIDDDNVACDSIIYGNATIKRSTAGTLGAIRTQNASSSLRIYADSIYDSISSVGSIRCVNGSQIITTNSIVNHSEVYCAAGSQTINCPLITHDGAGGYAFLCGGGTQTINGITSTGVFQTTCTGGTQTINNSTMGALCLVSTTGTQNLNNCRVSVAVNTNCISQTGGGVSILKNCTLLTSGTGVSISNSSTIQLQGYNNANVEIGTSVIFTGSGNFNVNSGTT